MMIKKKEEGPYWPRLLKDKQKVTNTFVKTLKNTKNSPDLRANCPL